MAQVPADVTQPSADIHFLYQVLQASGRNERADLLADSAVIKEGQAMDRADAISSIEQLAE